MFPFDIVSIKVRTPIIYSLVQKQYDFATGFYSGLLKAFFRLKYICEFL